MTTGRAVAWLVVVESRSSSGRRVPLFASLAWGVIVIAFACVLPPVAAATFPGHNGRIAIAYTFGARCGDASIATMRSDGSGFRRLSPRRRNGCPKHGSMSQPDWSPDGRRLLYHHEAHMDDPGRIWMMNADGSGKRHIPLRRVSPVNWDDNAPENDDPFVAAEAPTFAPDGKRLAYVRWEHRSDDEDNRYGIWISDLHGSGNRRLRRADNLVTSPFGAPHWSPVGRTIAYWTGAGLVGQPDPVTFDEDRAYELSLVDARTGRTTRAVASTVVNTFVPSTGILDFSPRGRRILYAGPATDGGLWTVNADGTSAAPLLYMPGEFIRTAVWSPDGRRIAFTATRTTGEEFGMPIVRHSIWTATATGMNLRKLWESRAAAHYLMYPTLSWQPVSREPDRAPGPGERSRGPRAQ
jgi:Tol biopolymer transport system component